MSRFLQPLLYLDCIDRSTQYIFCSVFLATAAVLATGLRHMLEQKAAAAAAAAAPPQPPMTILPPKNEEEEKKQEEEAPLTLDQQENLKISGSNARHMVMQKLMRQAEVRKSGMP